MFPAGADVLVTVLSVSGNKEVPEPCNM
jgi:hypothetical protein